MYKVIFSDLDATLLTDDKKICERNILAIKKAQELGVKFIFCTGRLPFCYKEYSKLIDTSDAITTNGAVIFSDNKIISSVELSDKVKQTVLDYGIKNNRYERMFAIDYLYLLHPELGGNDTNFYEESRGVTEKEAKAIVKEEKLYKMAFHLQDHNVLLDIKKDIESLDLGVDLCFANDTFLEINTKGVSKGNGIRQYCKLKGIDLKDTIGIGDNDNDRTMLETVGLACCPSNAIPEIKAISDYISPVDNNDGAVADVIEKYILNNEQKG